MLVCICVKGEQHGCEGCNCECVRDGGGQCGYEGMNV